MILDFFAFLSEDRFRCLNFHDVALLDENQVEAIVRSLREVQIVFLRAINHQQLTKPEDAAFRRDLQAWANTKLSDIYHSDAKRAHLVDTTAAFMENFFPSSTHQVKMLVGTWTAALIVVDDSMSNLATREEVRLFVFRYLRHLSQPEGICSVIEQIMRDSDAFFQHKDPQLANMVITSALGFIDATYQEAQYVDEPLPQITRSHGEKIESQWCAEKFPYYLRNLTGMPLFYQAFAFTPSLEIEAPLAYWISAAEDMNRFTCLVNDLLSFPKELKARETTNNIPLRTYIKHQAGHQSQFDSTDGLWTCRDTLYSLILEMIENTRSVDQLIVAFSEDCSREFADRTSEENRAALRSQSELVEKSKLTAKLWKEYRRGYVSCYLEMPRYDNLSLRDSFQNVMGQQIDVVPGMPCSRNVLKLGQGSNNSKLSDHSIVGSFKLLTGSRLVVGCGLAAALGMLVAVLI